MPENVITKNKRSAFATFMNTATGSTETWNRFGKGVTSQKIAYNPTSNTEQYIDEDSANTSIDSYAPTMDGVMTTYKGEPIFEFVDKLRRERAVGSAAETDVLMVYMYAPGADSNSYEAEKQHVCIQIDEYGGDAGGSLPLNFTVNFMGDATPGTATITDGVPNFTAASK